MEVIKFVAHSKKAISIAQQHGWFPAARYTNMRDVRSFEFGSNGFLDIDWKNYDFGKHLDTAAKYKPKITLARDVECICQLEGILQEADRLLRHADHVAIVPKEN